MNIGWERLIQVQNKAHIFYQNSMQIFFSAEILGPFLFIKSKQHSFLGVYLNFPQKSYCHLLSHSDTISNFNSSSELHCSNELFITLIPFLQLWTLGRKVRYKWGKEIFGPLRCRSWSSSPHLLRFCGVAGRTIRAVSFMDTRGHEWGAHAAFLCSCNLAPDSQGLHLQSLLTVGVCAFISSLHFLTFRMSLSDLCDPH